VPVIGVATLLLTPNSTFAGASMATQFVWPEKKNDSFFSQTILDRATLISDKYQCTLFLLLMPSAVLVGNNKVSLLLLLLLLFFFSSATKYLSTRQLTHSSFLFFSPPHRSSTRFVSMKHRWHWHCHCLLNWQSH
jgi:hypothetical protein